MPIFYEITAPNGQKSYLFGTIHLQDKEINMLSLEVKQAFETASALYIEADTTSKDVSLNDWYHKHGHEHSRWAAIPGNVNEVIRQIASHFPWYFGLKSFVKGTPPLLVWGFSCVANQNSAKILDNNLVSMAKKRDINVYYLEDMSSHLNSLCCTELSYQEQRQLFDLFMKKKMANLNQIKNAYADDKLNETSREEYLDKFEEQDRHLVGRYWDEVFTKRDKKMAAKLEVPLLIGNAFVAVGASHLPGIIEIYQKKGYTINNIQITQRIYPVVDYYERSYFSMIYTGIAFILAGACLTGGLVISHKILSTGLLLIAAALATYALVKVGLLTYEYLTEPKLQINKVVDTTKPGSSRVSIFNNQPKVMLSNISNRSQQDLLDRLTSHSPILFLDVHAEENIDRIINYACPLYQLEETLGWRVMNKEPISQEEFENILKFSDPRDSYRYGS